MSFARQLIPARGPPDHALPLRADTDSQGRMDHPEQEVSERWLTSH